VKFVIASYNSFDNPQYPIRFGVVLNDGHKTYYYFDTSTKRRDEIQKISNHFDHDTFKEFSKTFEEMFIKPGVAYQTDENGIRQKINVNDSDFLDYLFQNSEGPYQYQRPLDVEGNNPKELVRIIAAQLIY
jgi:hypothetical protein